jgi:hypothetical protein
MTFSVKDIKADGRKKKVFYIDDVGAFVFLPDGEKSPAAVEGWQVYQDNRVEADAWISASIVPLP